MTKECHLHNQNTDSTGIRIALVQHWYSSVSNGMRLKYTQKCHNFKETYSEEEGEGQGGRDTKKKE